MLINHAQTDLGFTVVDVGDVVATGYLAFFGKTIPFAGDGQSFDQIASFVKDLYFTTGQEVKHIGIAIVVGRDQVIFAYLCGDGVIPFCIGYCPSRPMNGWWEQRCFLPTHLVSELSDDPMQAYRCTWKWRWMVPMIDWYSFLTTILLFSVGFSFSGLQRAGHWVCPKVVPQKHAQPWVCFVFSGICSTYFHQKLFSMSVASQSGWWIVFPEWKSGFPRLACGYLAGQYNMLPSFANLRSGHHFSRFFFLNSGRLLLNPG